MILSRRSLLVSLVLHCSLVIGGYFFYQSIEQGVVVPTQEGRPGLQVRSRTVTVEKPSIPIPSRRPSNSSQATEDPAVESRAESPERPSRSQPRQVKTKVAIKPAYPRAISRPKKAAPKATRPSQPRPKPVSTPFSGPPPGWGRVAPEPPGDGGENGNRSKVTRRAMPISQPEFNLTKRFPDLDSVEVKAKFEIAEDGSYEPTLLTSTGNPTADVVILGKLLEFEWRPALDKGVPIKDSRVLDISLEG
jgi:hypothetical protein